MNDHTERRNRRRGLRGWWNTIKRWWRRRVLHQPPPPLVVHLTADTGEFDRVMREMQQRMAEFQRKGGFATEEAARALLGDDSTTDQPAGCGNCNGSGWEVYPLDGGEGYPCPECDGTGQQPFQSAPVSGAGPTGRPSAGRSLAGGASTSGPPCEGSGGPEPAAK